MKKSISILALLVLSGLIGLPFPKLEAAGDGVFDRIRDFFTARPIFREPLYGWMQMTAFPGAMILSHFADIQTSHTWDCALATSHGDPEIAWGPRLGQAIKKAARPNVQTEKADRPWGYVFLHKGDINDCLMAFGFDPVLGICEKGIIETSSESETKVITNMPSSAMTDDIVDPGLSVSKQSASNRRTSAIMALDRARRENPIYVSEPCIQESPPPTNLSCGEASPPQISGGSGGGGSFSGLPDKTGGLGKSTVGRFGPQDPTKGIAYDSGRAASGGTVTRYTQYQATENGTLIMTLTYDSGTGNYAWNATECSSAGCGELGYSEGNIGSQSDASADAMSEFMYQATQDNWEANIGACGADEECDREGRVEILSRYMPACDDRDCGDFSSVIPQEWAGTFRRPGLAPGGYIPGSGGCTERPDDCPATGTPSGQPGGLGSPIVRNPIIDLVNPADPNVYGGGIGGGSANPCNPDAGIVTVRSEFYTDNCGGTSIGCDSPERFQEVLALWNQENATQRTIFRRVTTERKGATQREVDATATKRSAVPPARVKGSGAQQKRR